MRKHGFDAFSIVELAICPIANLNDLETYFIRYLGTHAKNGIGYNLTDGGNCAKFSEETKNKIRLTRLGKTHSAETKAKIAEARKGKNHSPETLAKMSKSGKSRVLSEESRLQISATLKARHAQKQALALLKIEGDTPCN